MDAEKRERAGLRMSSSGRLAFLALSWILATACADLIGLGPEREPAAGSGRAGNSSIDAGASSGTAGDAPWNTGGSGTASGGVSGAMSGGESGTNASIGGSAGTGGDSGASGASGSAQSGGAGGGCPQVPVPKVDATLNLLYFHDAEYIGGGDCMQERPPLSFLPGSNPANCDDTRRLLQGKQSIGFVRSASIAALNCFPEPFSEIWFETNLVVMESFGTGWDTFQPIYDSAAGKRERTGAAVVLDPTNHLGLRCPNGVTAWGTLIREFHPLPLNVQRTLTYTYSWQTNLARLWLRVTVSGGEASGPRDKPLASLNCECGSPPNGWYSETLTNTSAGNAYLDNIRIATSVEAIDKSYWPASASAGE